MYWRKPSETICASGAVAGGDAGQQVIPLEFDGVRAGNQSRGHRILADGPVAIPRAGPAYIEALRAAKVLAANEREQQIRKALDAATRTIPGARWREDKALLDTVVNLTEWPSAILGSFDRRVSRASRRSSGHGDAGPSEIFCHRRCGRQTAAAFSGGAEHGWRSAAASFVTATNACCAPVSTMLASSGRPIRSIRCASGVEWLRNVTFQKDLGQLLRKDASACSACAVGFAKIIRQNGMQIRPGVVHKAASLAKTDLTTELVKEFTELQGIVGGLYASVQQLDAACRSNAQAIAEAIYDHYKPESMEDSVPRTVEGAVLSIADKADTIAGMFALGLQPTGSKDPFALRRQANGIVKTIAEHKLPLSLRRIVHADAREVYAGRRRKRSFHARLISRKRCERFFRERLEFYLRECSGYKYDVVNAVLAADADDVVDAVARAEAVTKVRGSADFESISVAFKRIKNILAAGEETGKRVRSDGRSACVREAAEKELAAQIPRVGCDRRGVSRAGAELRAGVAGDLKDCVRQWTSFSTRSW